MIASFRSLLAAVAAALTLSLSGCGRADGPRPLASEPDASDVQDHHDAPITEADVELPATYAQAIPRIASYRDAIRAAVKAGTPSKAHRPLDELEVVLGKLPSIAKDSGIPKSDWETINTAARELRNLFNQLHSAIDEQRAPDYDAVAEPIEDAIAKLQQVAP